jgi:pimeloyl-ACP methyl ester carboxylesterase
MPRTWRGSSPVAVPAGTTVRTTASSEVVVLGHSMGGVVGLALAKGLFAVNVTSAIGVGIKVTWRDEDLEWIRASVARPVRWFDTRKEATERFLRLAGLPADGLEDGALARAAWPNRTAASAWPWIRPRPRSVHRRRRTC